jgi:hypothetical protein
LRRALGEEAAEEFVDWMDDVESRRDTVRADIVELRQHLDGKLAEIQLQLAGLRQEIRDGDANLRQELRDGDARSSDAIKQARFDLVIWSFVFWVSAVGSIAMLARALR